MLVLERGRTGAEATGAAGGMLSPLGESAGPGVGLRLGLDSLALWVEYAAALTAESGVDLDLRLDGKLLLALDEGAAARLRAHRGWIAEAGERAEWLEGDALGRREPGAAHAAAGLLLPDEGQVDNRALARALRVAAERAGCEVREGAEVAALLTRGGAVAGVRLADGARLGADRVILAAGAWSGALAGLPRPLPVRPVKGQMIALGSRPGAGAPVRALVETEECYVIPRAGGSVWVGATSEEVGFTRGTSAHARAALRAAAARAVPALASAHETEAWDGFRPGTPDGLPLLGSDPELSGLVHATGHYRNGILLTPITARLIGSVVAGRPEPGLDGLGIARFAAG